MDTNTASRLQGEERTEYLALCRMMESQGFDYLKRRFSLELGSAQARKDAASSWEEQRVAHGQVQVYQTLVDLDEVIENEFYSIAFLSDEEQE